MTRLSDREFVFKITPSASNYRWFLACLIISKACTYFYERTDTSGGSEISGAPQRPNCFQFHAVFCHWKWKFVGANRQNFPKKLYENERIWTERGSVSFQLPWIRPWLHMCILDNGGVMLLFKYTATQIFHRIHCYKSTDLIAKSVRKFYKFNVHQLRELSVKNSKDRLLCVVKKGSKLQIYRAKSEICVIRRLCNVLWNAILHLSDLDFQFQNIRVQPKKETLISTENINTLASIQHFTHAASNCINLL